MPLEEPSYEPRSIDEVQYGQEIANKIKATLVCPEKVAQRYKEYFKEIDQPVSNFFTMRWGNDIGGIQTAVSEELRPDIAQEIKDEIAKTWSE